MTARCGTWVHARVQSAPRPAGDGQMFTAGPLASPFMTARKHVAISIAAAAPTRHWAAAAAGRARSGAAAAAAPPLLCRSLQPSHAGNPPDVKLLERLGVDQTDLELVLDQLDQLLPEGFELPAERATLAGIQAHLAAVAAVLIRYGVSRDCAVQLLLDCPMLLLCDPATHLAPKFALLSQLCPHSQGWPDALSGVLCEPGGPLLLGAAAFERAVQLTAAQLPRLCPRRAMQMRVPRPGASTSSGGCSSSGCHAGEGGSSRGGSGAAQLARYMGWNTEEAAAALSEDPAPLLRHKLPQLQQHLHWSAATTAAALLGGWGPQLARVQSAAVGGWMAWLAGLGLQRRQAGELLAAWDVWLPPRVGSPGSPGSREDASGSGSHCCSAAAASTGTLAAAQTEVQQLAESADVEPALAAHLYFLFHGPSPDRARELGRAVHLLEDSLGMSWHQLQSFLLAGGLRQGATRAGLADRLDCLHDALGSRDALRTLLCQHPELAGMPELELPRALAHLRSRHAFPGPAPVLV